MSPARRILTVLLVVATACVAILAVALIALQTPWARGALRDEAERQAERYLQADVEIGRLGGTLLFGAVLDDLTIERNGTRVAAIDRVSVDYDVFDFLQGRYDLEEVVLTQPVLQPEALAAFGALGGRPGGGQPSDGPGFALASLVIQNGRVLIGEEPEEVGGFRVPDVIRDLDAELSIAVRSGRTTVTVERLSFRGSSPKVVLQSLTGTVAFADGDLVLENIAVQLDESSFEFGGTIENVRDIGAS